MPDGRGIARVADGSAADLLRILELGATRLRLLIGAAVADERFGQAEWREQRLAETVQLIARVRRDSAAAGPLAVQVAYSHGALATSEALGITTAFGPLHVQVVQALSEGLAGRLDDGLRTVGRQTEDVFRTVALRELAVAEAAGQGTREAAVRIAGELADQGVTAFVARNGARWKLDTYGRMVARTSMREAVTLGTATRMVENGFDLVTVSDHGDTDEVCAEFAGNTYSLNGTTDGYDALDELPPFHPNCLHVLTPAEATFDDYERQLGVSD